VNKFISGTFAADGSSASIVIEAVGLAFIGGAGGADFGTGTVQVEAKGPDNQWYPSGDPISAADVKSLSFSLPTEIRLTLADATDPDLDYAIQSDATKYRD
jgi:hypothetical protein